MRLSGQPPKPDSAFRNGFSGLRKAWHKCQVYDYPFPSKQHLREHTSPPPDSRPYKDMMNAKSTSTTSYNGTRDLYKYTDCMVSNYSFISSFYSGRKLNGAWDNGKTWNREHTWLNSKISGNGENDIMMLRPTSVKENSDRGNKAYGEGSSCYDPNVEASPNGFNVRGDCARIILYVYVRWGTFSSPVATAEFSKFLPY